MRERPRNWGIGKARTVDSRRGLEDWFFLGGAKCKSRTYSCGKSASIQGSIKIS